MRGKVVLLTVTLAQGAVAEEMPPPGLLEYLGAMVESDGELLDPLDMASAVEAALAEPGDDARASDTAAADAPLNVEEETP